MEVKDIIRKSRLKKGYTMAQLANMIGCSESAVSRWESGDIDNLRINNLLRLSMALDVDVHIITDTIKNQLESTDFRGKRQIFRQSLLELRKQKGWTQEELANRLELSKSSISMYENGEREPNYEILMEIADVFDVDLNYLFGDTENFELNTMVKKLSQANRDKVLSYVGYLLLCQTKELP